MADMEQNGNILTLLEAATADPGSPLYFTPVRLRRRRDGWTEERQRRFIAYVALTGRSKFAAALVDMTPQSACRLRRQSEGTRFGAALGAAYSLARRARAASAQGSSGAAFLVSMEAELSEPCEPFAEPSAARPPGVLAGRGGDAIARP
jgi:hypothetical protein